MAIDGIKIIDSDDAYDIYNDIVERYKDGTDVDIIKKDWLNEESNFCTDELYKEIYWTALAYALWKIGNPDENIKNKALEIISKGPSKLWNEIDEKAIKARQKALNKLAEQIQSENLRPIKKPKPRKRREPYFELGDVISIKFEHEYGICFISDLEVRPRKIEYHIACARTLQNSEPTIDDFINSSIAYKKMNTEFVLETDCPYLSPVPNRGKRNSSLNLTYIIDKLSEIKGVSKDFIIEKSFENAKKLYPKMK